MYNIATSFMNLNVRFKKWLSKKEKVSANLSRKDFKGAFLCGLFSLIIFTPFVFLGVDFIHDGVLLATAYALNRGAVIFRDVFTQYGPLTAYIHLLSFKLFGESLFSMHLITLIFYMIISFFFYLISRFYLSKFEAIIAFLLWVFSAYFLSWRTAFPWPSAYSLAFSLISTYFAIIGLYKKSRYFILTGFFTSLAFWSKQNVGLAFLAFTFAYLLIYLFFGDKKEHKFYLTNIIYLATGFALPTIGYILYLIKQSALSDMWLDMFVFIFNWGKRYADNYGLITVLRNLFPDTFIYLFRIILPLFSICILFLMSVDRNKTRLFKLFLLASTALISPLILIPFLRNYLNTIVSDPILLLTLAICNVFGLLIFFISLKEQRAKVFDKKNAKLIFLLFSSLAAWTQFHPLNDQVHAFYSIPLMLILGCLELDWLLKKMVTQFNPGLKSSMLVRNLLFLLVALAFWLPGGYPRSYWAVIKLVSIPKMKFIHKPPILSGMLETRDYASSIENLADELYKIKAQYPRSNIQILGNLPLALTFIPDNHFPKIFADWGDSIKWGDFENRTFPGYREGELERIKIEKPIIVVTGDYFDKATDYAAQLNYKLVLSEPDIKNAVLLPNL